MTWGRLWGRFQCVLFGHQFGEWIELDLTAPSPREFMRQCTSCLRLQYGKRTVQSGIRPTKVDA